LLGRKSVDVDFVRAEASKQSSLNFQVCTIDLKTYFDSRIS